MTVEQNIERFVSDGNYNISYNGKKGNEAVNELSQKKVREEAQAYEKYIPLGSIVSLEDNKKMMVIGYNGLDNDVTYDYIGCEFPYGVDKKHSASLFNHDMISKFYHLGYVNDQGNYYRSQLSKDSDSDIIKKA